MIAQITPESVVVSPIAVSRRYRIVAPLGQGGMGSVYRAIDRLTGEAVALKRVFLSADEEASTVSTPGSITNPRVALAQEFQSLATLRHPHIISVRDYGFDIQGHPYFTMDLVEIAQTIVEACQEQPVINRVELLVHVLHALAYVHRRGFIHRDLKPSNVLVAGGIARVLDFGLSVTADQAAGTVGTLAYMAPEVLYGGAIGPASDLYALGVIAYEALTGRHPFNKQDTGSLVTDILKTMPDVRSAGLEPPLAAILERLLAKQAADRYGDAGQVIEAFSEAVGHSFQQEITATRESFLQAARFVGRATELSQLKDALAQAMNGYGSAWFIAGESGVGKSRLVDELRTHALVAGAVVLRGQAVSTGRSPYRLWRRSIRRLVLISELDDLEASVLKTLVPDIAVLLERDVPDAPELDSQTAQMRLLSVVVEIVRRQAQVQPVVMILEDLHWAGDESWELLSALVRVVPELPLLIISNYRDDEPLAWAQRLLDVPVMKLQRLTKEAIGALSESMIGETGRQPQVVNLLQRETEGNPLFLVEVVRALAEEAGQLEKIGLSTLPASVFTGGLQRLVERRLNQVPATAQPPLRFAAIAGRAIDLALIRAAFPAIDAESWLTACANAAVVAVQDGRWQFAHDKLREGLLANLPDEECRALHRQVAAAIEAVYPGSPDQMAALTYHWATAGDRGKEGHYAALAGEQALRSGANREAVRFLERALGLLTTTDQDEERLQLQQAQLRRQLGQAYLGLGRLAESRAYLQETVASLGWPVPAQPGLLAATLLRQVLTQVWHRYRPGWGARRVSPERVAVLLEATRAYQQLAEIYYFANETMQTLNAGLHALNLSESAGPSPELARAYANMCVIAGLMSQDKMAQAYGRRALATARQVDDLPALAWVLLLSGTHDASNGRWFHIRQKAEQAIALCRRTGDQRILGLSLGLLALVPYHQGHFAQSAQLYADWLAAATEIDNVQHQGFGLFGQSENALRLGTLDKAAALAQEGLTLLDEQTEDTVENRTAKLRGYGLLAAARLRQGEQQAAQQAADAALGLMVQLALPTRVTSLEGFAGAVEVYLTLWEINGRTTMLVRASRQACAGLRRYARVFAIGQPRTWLWRGVYEWLNGRPARARRAWQKSLAAAERLDMPLEKTLVHYQISRHTTGAEREAHLNQAAALFTRLEAAHELAQVEKLRRTP
ncbi:MAG TPA: AAA family ATPase [Anaerolineae bacterium]